MRLRAVAAGALALVLAMAPAAAETALPPSQAFVQGMDAYRKGDVEQALPLLDHAARQGYFLAQFKLAGIYADPRGGQLNELAAFRLYEGIAEGNREIEPYLDPRAHYVGLAFLALGRYWQNGIADSEIRPDLHRARDYYVYAASYFDNADAQFELARISLADAADKDAVADGLHWLMTLAEDRDHIGAQAYLGELFWSGEHVSRRPALGLALATIALAGAGDGDRLWIEDGFQRMYCAATAKTRARAGQLVENWLSSRKFGELIPEGDAGSVEPAGEDGFVSLGGMTRTCANGEVIALPRPRSSAPGLDELNEAPATAPGVYAGSQEIGVREAGADAGTFGGAMGLGFTSPADGDTAAAGD